MMGRGVLLRTLAFDSWTKHHMQVELVISFHNVRASRVLKFSFLTRNNINFWNSIFIWTVDEEALFITFTGIIHLINNLVWEIEMIRSDALSRGYLSSYYKTCWQIMFAANLAEYFKCLICLQIKKNSTS